MVQTDHKSLIHLGEQQLTTSMQQKAFVKLMGLQYKIKYKRGQENTAANALSRKEEEEESNAITSSVPRWLEIVLEGYEQDDEAKQLMSTLCLQNNEPGAFQLCD